MLQRDIKMLTIQPIGKIVRQKALRKIAAGIAELVFEGTPSPHE